MQTVQRTSRHRLLLLLSLAAALALLAGGRWLNNALAERRLESASLEELQSLSKQRPDDAKAFHFLGMRAAHAGNAPAALNAFWRAVQLAPGSEEDWLGWAAAVRDTSGPQAADAVLEACLKQNPRSAKSMLERARIYRTLEYHRLAFQYAEQATQTDPTLVAAWGIMAEQAREARDYATAESAAKRAIALAPQDWRCHLELGKAYLADHHTEDAIAAFRQSVQLGPERAATHLGLGVGLLASARTHPDLEAVRQSLNSAARLEKDLGPHERFLLNLSLGQSFQREANGKEALGPLLEAEKLEPGDETIHYTLSQVYRGLGESANAALETRIHQDIAQYHAGIRFLELQITGAPDDPAPRLKLARLYASRGNVVDAAKTYKAMISRGLERDLAERELKALESTPTVAPR